MYYSLLLFYVPLDCKINSTFGKWFLTKFGIYSCTKFRNDIRIVMLTISSRENQLSFVSNVPRVTAERKLCSLVIILKIILNFTKSCEQCPLLFRNRNIYRPYMYTWVFVVKPKHTAYIHTFMLHLCTYTLHTFIIAYMYLCVYSYM